MNSRKGQPSFESDQSDLAMKSVVQKTRERVLDNFQAFLSGDKMGGDIRGTEQRFQKWFFGRRGLALHELFSQFKECARTSSIEVLIDVSGGETGELTFINMSDSPHTIRTGQLSIRALSEKATLRSECSDGEWVHDIPLFSAVTTGDYIVNLPGTTMGKLSSYCASIISFKNDRNFTEAIRNGKAGVVLTCWIDEARVCKEVLVAEVSDRENWQRLAQGTFTSFPTRAETGAPAFFRALCATATSGGKQGYLAAGHELARHTGRLLDLDESTPDKFEQLVDAIDNEKMGEVLSWYDREFPDCMKLIPRRRRSQFLTGVVNARKGDLLML